MPRQAAGIVASAATITHIRPCQRAGRPRRSISLRRGKSGLHGTTVPGNARRPPRRRGSGIVPQKAVSLSSGRSSRKGAARAHRARRQRPRHGKPHRVQDRIGAARSFGSGALFRLAARVGRWRGGVTRPVEEWSPIRRGNAAMDRTRLTGPLALLSVVIARSAATRQSIEADGLLRSARNDGRGNLGTQHGRP